MNFLTLIISAFVYCYRFIRFTFGNFFNAVAHAFINYFSFSGRATRSQFWYFFLFCILLYLCTLSVSIEGLEEVISNADSSQESSREILTYLLTSWFGLSVMITFIPQITLSIRRLHDIGKSGWWQLLYITIIGGIVVLIWLVTDTVKRKNQFGPVPKK